MALTEEETVQLLQNAAVDYFRSLDTTAKWVNFVNIVSKSVVKTFIQNALTSTANNYDTSSADLAAKADDLEALVTTVGNI